MNTVLFSNSFNIFKQTLVLTTYTDRCIKYKKNKIIHKNFFFKKKKEKNVLKWS